MNYKNGMFRLWLAFTIIWIAYLGFAINNNVKMISFYENSELMTQAQIVGKYPNDLLKNPLSEVTLSEIETLKTETIRLNTKLNYEKKELENNIFGLTLPIILLIGYFIFIWIGQGFMSSKQ